jgi:hypothetical protein
MQQGRFVSIRRCSRQRREISVVLFWRATPGQFWRALKQHDIIARQHGVVARQGPLDRLGGGHGVRVPQILTAIFPEAGYLLDSSDPNI